MEDLTLDVCVLMSGSGIGNENYEEMSRGLMLRMLKYEDYKLAIDERGKIAYQYGTKCKGTTLGRYFFKMMEDRNKIIIIKWKELNKGIRVKLEEQGFTRDGEDYKYVVAASGAICKKLVSHEKHFFIVAKILRKIGINILMPDMA